MKKLLALILVFIMFGVTCAFAAPSDVAWSPEQMPFFEEKHDLSLVLIRSLSSPMNAEDKWFYHWASDAMGINFELTEIEQTERNEKLNLLFASDDLPDVFYDCSLTSNEISLYGAKEGQLISMNDAIEQYGPNIKAFMTLEPTYAATMYYTDGSIYALPCFLSYNAYENYTTTRAWLNQRWMKNLGLEDPETLDEFHDVLLAFKQQYANGNGDPNDEIPLGESMPNITQLMMNLMGIMTRQSNTMDPALYKGEAIVPANDKDLYKALLELLQKYYSEGLIDPDVFTFTGTQQQANATADIIGLHMQGAPYSLPIADFNDWTTVHALTSSFNDTLQWPESDPMQYGKYAVSYKCDDVEAAIRFADWHFTQQGSMYSFFGPCEDSEDLIGMIDGWYYKEDTKSVDFHYPEGMEEKQINYVSYIGNGRHTHVGISMNYTAIETYLGHPVENQAFGGPAYWRALMDQFNVPYYTPCYPALYFDPEIANRMIELETPLKDYAKIMEAKFISGEVSMDQFDNYWDELQKMGLGEYATCYTDAYATYLTHVN